MTKDKTINYVSLTIETAPDISAGVVLVAYIVELPIESRYFLCDSEGNIRAVSRGFCKSFDVPPDYTENIFRTLYSDAKELGDNPNIPVKKTLSIRMESNAASVRRLI